jgi:tetratricopeptide (TPR) repeat protein
MLHESIADLQTLLGEYGAAIQSYQLAAISAEPRSFAGIEHKIGNVYQRQGELELAENYYRIALESLPAEVLPGEHVRILADWSLAAFRHKDHLGAQALAIQALSASENSEDPHVLSQVHNILGILARNQNDLSAAIDHLEQSLTLAEEIGDPGMRAAALNNLALVYSVNQDLERAISLTEKALELCMLLGDRHREAALHSNMADLLHEIGQPDAAIAHLKKSAAIFAEIGAETGDLNPEVWKLTEW